MNSRHRKMRMEQLEGRELMAVTSAANLNAVTSSSPTGDVAAIVQNGNLVITEAASQLNKDNGIRITQLSNGRIRVQGTEGNNGAATLSKVNGQAYQDFTVNGSLFVTLAGGNDRVQIGTDGDGGTAPKFNELRIDVAAPESSGPVNAKTPVPDDDQVFLWSANTRAVTNIATGRGNDWVFVAKATVGDGVGNDDLLINTGAGTDQVTVKGAHIRRNLDVQTYSALTETDADVVYFDALQQIAPRIDGSVNVRTGGGNDTFYVTDPADDDLFTQYDGIDVKGSMTIDTGAGNDTAFVRNMRVAGNLSLNSGAGADTLTFRQAPRPGGNTTGVQGEMKITTFAAALENDADSLSLDYAAGRLGLSVAMGGGNDRLVMNNVPSPSITLDLGAGNDTAELTKVHPKDYFFADLGDGNDTLRLIEFYEPHGPSKMSGGNGTDRLVTEGTTLTTTVRTGWEYLNGVPQTPGNDPGVAKAKKK